MNAVLPASSFTASPFLQEFQDGGVGLAAALAHGLQPVPDAVVAHAPFEGLAMDLDNLTRFLASYTPSRVVAARADGDMLVDRYHLDAQAGRLEAERTVIRDGRARRMNFVKRLFGFPELRDWLLSAGFTTVSGYGEDARPLTADHKRMVIVAGLP
jgi:hypothetical protein